MTTNEKKRLFIACDLPQSALEALISLQPATGLGVRLTRADQIHLTLHFVGEADIERLLLPLQNVARERFELTLAGVGQFASRDGMAILWAGVELSPELLDLQKQIGNLLVRQGFSIEHRPYKPHLTLARCRIHSAGRAIESFLTKNVDFRIPDLLVDSFALYSSQLDPGGPIYTCERRYPLQ